MVLELHNPHSVLAAVAARPKAVLEICLHAKRASGPWGNVVAAATRQGIAVRAGVQRRDHGRRRGPEDAPETRRSGSAFARVLPRDDQPLDQLGALI